VVGRGPKSVGGYFENSANTAAAFAANFSASGSNAYGVYGEARSNDFGSAGVHGRQLSNSGQVIGVEGVATDSPIGTGVVGRGGAVGGYFEGSGTQSRALALNNGGIQVLGAGAGTATPVFVHVVHDGAHGIPDNRCPPPDTNVTIIDNPYANGHPEAILFVTPGQPGPVPAAAHFVSYGFCTSGRWHVFLNSPFPLLDGDRINVMVINP
jgi:hypothetical protein